MANSPQSRKRARQAQNRRLRRVAQSSMVRTHLKRVAAGIESQDHAVALAAYQQVVPVLDRMVSKGIVPKNKAARHKRRFNRQIRALAA